MGTRKNYYIFLSKDLTKNPLLHESVFQCLSKNPLNFLKFPFWLFKGKPYFLKKIFELIEINEHSLPYRKEVLNFMQEQKSLGSKLFLVNEYELDFAPKIYKHLGFFDQIINFPNTEMLPLPLQPEKINLLKKAKIWIKQLRVHQWVKNLLVFVPIILSQKIVDLNLLICGLWAFLSFSLCASSVYLLNDLLDLENDRLHNTKKNRPIASGDVSIFSAILILPLLLSSSIWIAFNFLPIDFFWVLIVYYALTTLYSFKLKKLLLIDVFTLALLYTIRIIAGHEATDISYSPWLLGFSLFIFLSLAFLKRYSELFNLGSKLDSKKINGRGYSTQDLEQVRIFGASCGVISILVLSLYITSDKVQLLYHYPERLLAACIPLLYWIFRVWFLAGRGLMHEDPIVFAVKDKESYLCAFIILIIIFAAIGTGI